MKVAISKTVANNNTRQNYDKRNITFIRAGEWTRSQRKATAGLLNSASDWNLRIDLGK